MQTLTSVRASASHAVAATVRAALLCTMVLAECSGLSRACMTSWLWMPRRRGSCMAMFVSTVAALAMAPSRLLDRVLINASIPSPSAAALGQRSLLAQANLPFGYPVHGVEVMPLHTIPIPGRYRSTQKTETTFFLFLLKRKVGAEGNSRSCCVSSTVHKA